MNEVACHCHHAPTAATATTAVVPIERRKVSTYRWPQPITRVTDALTALGTAADGLVVYEYEHEREQVTTERLWLPFYNETTVTRTRDRIRFGR